MEATCRWQELGQVGEQRDGGSFPSSRPRSGARVGGQEVPTNGLSGQRSVTMTLHFTDVLTPTHSLPSTWNCSEFLQRWGDWGAYHRH